MTTVTSPSITSAYGIICDAMKDTGKLRAGSEPDPVTTAEYIRRLNKLINFYMTQGLKLWLIEDVAITLSGTPLYTLGPTGTVVMQKPLRVISSYYLDTDNNQRPLICLSWDEYKRLSNVITPGAVNSYFVDKQQATLNVYFWMTPDLWTATNGASHVIIEQSVVNFVGINDNMNFPIEWGLLLEWGLADQTSTGQPTTIIARCAAMENKYRTALEDWDVEDADTMFQPDQRSEQYRGKFR